MIILASQSPRRAELLTQAGIDFRTLPADIDESMLDGEVPADFVEAHRHRQGQDRASRTTPTRSSSAPIPWSCSTIACSPSRATADGIEMLLTLAGRSQPKC